MTNQRDKCRDMRKLHGVHLEQQPNSEEVICVLEEEEFEIHGLRSVETLIIASNISMWMSHPSL